MKSAWYPRRLGKLPPSLIATVDKSPRYTGAAGCRWQIEYKGALYRDFSRGKETGAGAKFPKASLSH
jgi:hypothetical protein